MRNSQKIILDLCGGTGAWSEPYRDAGYTVHVITLPQFDITKAHLDEVAGLHIVFPYANSSKQGLLEMQGLEVPLSRIHGILAAPPCTEFSVAKNGSHSSRDYEKGLETVRACLETIWIARAHGTLKWWALENPRGYLRQFLGVPHFTYEHWQYGSKEHLKPTDIWGYFKEPGHTHRKRPDKALQVGRRGHALAWVSPKKPAKYAHLTLDRAAIRAITPKGFARAFARANR